jgi:hypothetical protein
MKTEKTDVMKTYHKTNEDLKKYGLEKPQFLSNKSLGVRVLDLSDDQSLKTYKTETTRVQKATENLKEESQKLHNSFDSFQNPVSERQSEHNAPTQLQQNTSTQTKTYAKRGATIGLIAGVIGSGVLAGLWATGTLSLIPAVTIGAMTIPAIGVTIGAVALGIGFCALIGAGIGSLSGHQVKVKDSKENHMTKTQNILFGREEWLSNITSIDDESLDKEPIESLKSIELSTTSFDERKMGSLAISGISATEKDLFSSEINMLNEIGPKT